MSPSADAADLGGLRVALEPAERALVVRLEGELDLAGAPSLATALESARHEPGAAVPLVLDLSAVTFMDSTGVRTLVDADRGAREQGRAFALMRPSPAVRRVLELVDLRRAFVEIEDVDPGSLARAGLRGA